jgi:predicted DNA-binding transcriptional regulator AlpA
MSPTTELSRKIASILEGEAAPKRRFLSRREILAEKVPWKSVKTFDSYVRRGDFPPPAMVTGSGRAWWSEADVDAFLESRIQGARRAA